MKNVSCPKILKPPVSAETGTSALGFSPRCRHLCFEAFEVFVAQAEPLCRWSQALYIYLMRTVRACMCLYYYNVDFRKTYGKALGLQNKIAGKKSPFALLRASMRYLLPKPGSRQHHPEDPGETICWRDWKSSLSCACRNPSLPLLPAPGFTLLKLRGNIATENARQHREQSDCECPPRLGAAKQLT